MSWPSSNKFFKSSPLRQPPTFFFGFSWDWQSLVQCARKKINEERENIIFVRLLFCTHFMCHRIYASCIDLLRIENCSSFRLDMDRFDFVNRKQHYDFFGRQSVSPLWHSPTLHLLKILKSSLKLCVRKRTYTLMEKMQRLWKSHQQSWNRPISSPRRIGPDCSNKFRSVGSRIVPAHTPAAMPGAFAAARVGGRARLMRDGRDYVQATHA